MCKRSNESGHSSVELILVMGFILLPSLMIGIRWMQKEWDQSQCAFQSFKTARLQLIRTQQATLLNGISLSPLEDLDQKKTGLVFGDAAKQVSRLWEQL